MCTYNSSVPGSEIVGTAELRKREEESKTGGNCPPTFRVPFSFVSSPLYQSLEQASLRPENFQLCRYSDFQLQPYRKKTRIITELHNYITSKMKLSKQCNFS